MYDDFMSGMNYGSVKPPVAQQQYTNTTRQVQGRVVQVRKPMDYNKTPQIYMKNRYNDIAELWANGNVFIRSTEDNSVRKMRYPSRPEAIRTLTRKGWTIVPKQGESFAR
jgi:hypothetical protein